MAVKTTHVILGAAVGAGAALAAIAGVSGQPATDAARSGKFLPTSTASAGLSGSPAPMSFADIFEKVSPAVVSINVTSHGDPASNSQASRLRKLPL